MIDHLIYFFSRSPLSSIIGLVTFIALLWGLPQPKRKYLIILTILLLFIGCFVVPPYQSNTCKMAGKTPVYHTGLSNNAHYYTTLYSDTVDMNKSDKQFDEIRNEKLGQLFLKADATKKLEINSFSYKEKLLPFFYNHDALSKKVIDELFKNLFVYVNENVDTVNCRYSVAISLAKTKVRAIDSLIALSQLLGCMGNSVDDLIIKPLQSRGEVSISFFSIFKKLCTTCPNDPRVILWKHDSHDGISDADSLYFEKGQYRLSVTSMVLLRCIAGSLSRYGSKNLRVELHGFTDSSPVRSMIPYTESGHKADKGTLLPGQISQPITGITNNIDLSFARAFSCYNELNDLVDQSKIKLFYTGEGLSERQDIPEAHQRSVTIFIKKEQE